MLKQKGRRNNVRLETERDKDFKQLNNSHQSIESDINQPEHHGLNKCPDKGEENFEKYVALAVLSYNLHRLGNLIKKKSIKENASSFMSLNISNHRIAMSENQLSDQNDGVYQKILQQKLKTP